MQLSLKKQRNKLFEALPPDNECQLISPKQLTFQSRPYFTLRCDAETLDLFGIFSGKDTHYIYPNGDEVSNIEIVYICKKYSGTLTCQNEEVNSLQFFHHNEIPNNISPPSVSHSQNGSKKKKETLYEYYKK